MLLPDTTSHLILRVLPSAGDYFAAESGLSLALLNALEAEGISARQATSQDWTLALDRCEREAQLAFRRAAEFALAADGLTDRAALEISLSDKRSAVDRAKNQIRSEISLRCLWPDSAVAREGAFDRVRAVANAYKHRKINDPGLPITSEDDVLVMGTSSGVDCYGVGKFSGIEVIVKEPATGSVWKFLGDCPVVIGAWLSFLRDRGAVIGPGPFVVCGLNVTPR